MWGVVKEEAARVRVTVVKEEAARVEDDGHLWAMAI